ncbi:signal peptidase I [Acutalibacter intestini]|uniref:signal peptidase I n=1 Tax=Acutalibacter intestini TaxID=3093659 RepID=UPI002AC8BE74|nr:signal peptidase I [Acutalibacter sp. M00204]
MSEQEIYKPSPEDEENGRSPFRVWALEWLETIVAAFVMVTVLFTFAARVITVDGGSMEPTYFDGDRVLVTSLAGEAQQGDVVIIVHALHDTIIKRVVATEGQWVDFDPEARELLVDGIPLKGEEFGIPNGITMTADMPDMMLTFPQQVPEGCVFVLGDNREHSTDSRYLAVGMVDRRNILGRVVFNLYPFSKAGMVR